MCKCEVGLGEDRYTATDPLTIKPTEEINHSALNKVVYIVRTINKIPTCGLDAHPG